ncbi:MAG: hypothetical protein ACRC1H_13540, partial [Caldilineaceae bacterium]
QPLATRPGSCDARSLFAPRADAWRCTVEGTVFDPCFELHAGGAGAIVCGAEPLSGALGFAVGGALPPALPTSAAAPIDPSSLDSLTYAIDLLPTPVTLSRGQFYVPWVDQTGGSLLVGLSELRAEGDLDGDGDADQAALLVADAADDRMFIYLGAIINEPAGPRASATLALGDRVKVDNLEIANGQIIVTMTTHTGDDPACCPTLDVNYHYVLAGDWLRQVADGWRLELAGGNQCLPVQSQAAGGGMQFSYQCSDGTWLRSGLIPGKVWGAVPAGGRSEEPANAGAATVTAIGTGAAPAAGVSGGTPATVSGADSGTVPVVRVWQ